MIDDDDDTDEGNDYDDDNGDDILLRVPLHSLESEVKPLAVSICVQIRPVDNNDKVNRCLARYSPRATTTNRPTNRAPKKPAWPGPN